MRRIGAGLLPEGCLESSLDYIAQALTGTSVTKIEMTIEPASPTPFAVPLFIYAGDIMARGKKNIPPPGLPLGTFASAKGSFPEATSGD